MEITAKVDRVLDVEHISSTELLQMVEKAAITSVRGFNRRFHHWLFKLDKGSITDMQTTEMVEVGHGSERMREDCEACEGEGCQVCGWVGQILRRL